MTEEQAVETYLRLKGKRLPRDLRKILPKTREQVERVKNAYYFWGYSHGWDDAKAAGTDIQED